MKHYFYSVLIIFLVLQTSCISEKPVLENNFIIPEPVKFESNGETFILSSETIIYMNEKDTLLKGLGEYFNTHIERATGWRLRTNVSDTLSLDSIEIYLDPALQILGQEGYNIEIRNHKMVLSAFHSKGIFYALQSIFQLLPEAFHKNKGLKNIKSISIPGIEISDSPKFGWRGYMLDASRHFQSIKFVKKMLDLLAFYKINVFHWHLTDGHGWRIEIDQYPELTEKGAWRKQPGYDKGLYGGFYTKEEIREVVEYARKRNITIVPEIEMPGHSVEVNAVYPEFSCTDEKAVVAYFESFPPTRQWFPDCGPDALCAGNEKVYEFLENVLREVIELFPSKYIHIGGDECEKTDWKKCYKCQAKMKAEGLKDEEELQSYFIRRIEHFLNKKKRKLIGWDEILEGGLADNATVMSWRGEQGGIIAAKKGHDVVMTPEKYVYLDHAQSDDPKHPRSWGKDISTLEEVYQYHPVPEALTKQEAEHILGAQGNMWTIYANTESLVETMTFPRLLALSEALWIKKEDKNWGRFLQKMQSHYKRLDYIGVAYYKEVPKPLVKDTLVGFVNETTIKVAPPFKEAKVVYTTDGSEPNKNSQILNGSLSIDKTMALKLKTLTAKEELSNTIVIKVNKLDYISPQDNIYYTGILKLFSYTGNFKSALELNTAQPVNETYVNTISIPYNAKGNNTGLKFEGVLNIEQEGIYTFYIESDDGSILWLNDTIILNHDGMHEPFEKQNIAALKEGKYKMQLNYFQGEGSQSLKVSWSGPGFKKQPLRLSKLDTEKKETKKEK